MTPPESLHDQYFGHQHLTVIRPTQGWRSLDLKELWAYRELLWVHTLRDIKVRYKQTATGLYGKLVTQRCRGFDYSQNRQLT
jgi:lipopolysaccharide transport system permease protein